MLEQLRTTTAVDMEALKGAGKWELITQAQNMHQTQHQPRACARPWT